MSRDFSLTSGKFKCSISYNTQTPGGCDSTHTQTNMLMYKHSVFMMLFSLEPEAGTLKSNLFLVCVCNKIWKILKILNKYYKWRESKRRSEGRERLFLRYWKIFKYLRNRKLSSLSICLSLFPSVFLSLHVSLSPSVSLHVSLSISTSLSLCLWSLSSINAALGV